MGINAVDETNNGYDVNSCIFGKCVNADTSTARDHGRGFQDEAISALDQHELKMKRQRTLLFRLHFLIDLNEVVHDRGIVMRGDLH